MSVLLVASLVWPVISSVVNGLSGRGVRRAGRGYMAENFYFWYIEITNYFNYESRFKIEFFQEIIYLG